MSSYINTYCPECFNCNFFTLYSQEVSEVDTIIISVLYLRQVSTFDTLRIVIGT